MLVQYKQPLENKSIHECERLCRSVGSHVKVMSFYRQSPQGQVALSAVIPKESSRWQSSRKKSVVCSPSLNTALGQTQCVQNGVVILSLNPLLLSRRGLARCFQDRMTTLSPKSLPLYIHSRLGVNMMFKGWSCLFLRPNPSPLSRHGTSKMFKGWSTFFRVFYILVFESCFSCWYIFRIM